MLNFFLIIVEADASIAFVFTTKLHKVRLIIFSLTLISNRESTKSETVRYVNYCNIIVNHRKHRDSFYSSWSKALEDVERNVQHSEKFSLD